MPAALRWLSGQGQDNRKGPKCRIRETHHQVQPYRLFIDSPDTDYLHIVFSSHHGKSRNYCAFVENIFALRGHDGFYLYDL